MLDILRFIFSDFWIWLGTILMLEVITEGVRGLIRIVINRK